MVTVVVTADLLSRGRLERMDLRVSEVVSDWDLRDSGAYWSSGSSPRPAGAGSSSSCWPAWWATSPSAGGRCCPLVRVLIALALLTVVVYAFK